jgi:Protein of unknown function (DUF3723)
VEDMEKVWETILGPERGSAADAAVQGRVPKMCADDRKWLEDQMKSHSIFLSVTDVGARDRLLRRLLTIDVLIPTFDTLFQNLNYLALPRKVIAPLLPLRLEHSVYETLSELYTRDHSFERSYKDLWLRALRSWPSVLLEQPRQGRHWPRSSTAGTSTGCKDFSRFAEAIGFGHSQIAGSNPQPPSGRESVSTSFTTSGKGIPVRQRCGIPFRDSQEIDEEALVFDVILGPVGEPEAGITWPFVRRCFFIAFFGTFDDTPLDISPTAATGTLPPENTGHIQLPETALIPSSDTNMTREDIAGPAAAETAAATLSQNTDLAQHSERAVLPFPDVNMITMRVDRAKWLHADNVIHFLSHKGDPVGYQGLCGDVLLDQEEVKRKALRFFRPRENNLYVQNQTVSPDNAFVAATAHRPPERIYVVPKGSVNVFLQVRHWDAHSMPEARAERALVNTQESADGDTPENDGIE